MLFPCGAFQMSKIHRVPRGALSASQEGLDDLFFVTLNFVLQQAFASIPLLLVLGEYALHDFEMMIRRFGGINVHANNDSQISWRHSYPADPQKSKCGERSSRRACDASHPIALSIVTHFRPFPFS